MTKVSKHKKTLYLMRHATASMDAATDYERPLTATGERDARHMGRWLSEHHAEPDQILASPALRARTTAELVMEELHQRHTILFEQELYEASVRTFLDVVVNMSDTADCVLIVAHNPSITYLADYLTSDALEGMAPGALFGIGFDLDSWKEVSQQLGSTVCTMTPNQL